MGATTESKFFSCAPPREQRSLTSYVLKVDPFNGVGMLDQIINKILYNPNVYICTAVSPLITLRSARPNERSEIEGVA